MSDPLPTLERHQRHIEKFGAWVASVDHLTNERGTVEVETCAQCHYVDARCEHAKCEWDEDGTTLRCRLCDMDVT